MNKSVKGFRAVLISAVALSLVILGLSSYLVAQEKININTASVEQLEALAGIGPAKAQAIVKYREENGNFATTEDLKKVAGIGDKIFEQIKDQLTVGEEAGAEKPAPEAGGAEQPAQ